MRIGVIGGGQLGRMLGLAGIPLGLDFVFLDPSEHPPAAAAGRVIRAAFDDPAGLSALVDASDAMTYEFENVPVEALAALDAATPIRPNPSALAVAQVRSREKAAFEAAGIPVAPWRRAASQAELDAALADIGLPLIAKTESLGYDGKGQQRILRPEDASGAFDALGGVPLLVERLVAFDREVSVIGTRAADGTLRVYPLTENRHRDGILHRSVAPVADTQLRRQAVAHLRALCERTDYVGTMAIEFFVTGELLLGNEFAPRVHNSGHWTIEGATTSQFENHVRAVAGLPLGSADMRGHAGMVNLIGTMPERSAILRIDGAHLHDYGKSPRPGRKLGHVTVTAETAEALDRRLADVEHIAAGDVTGSTAAPPKKR